MPSSRCLQQCADSRRLSPAGHASLWSCRSSTSRLTCGAGSELSGQVCRGHTKLETNGKKLKFRTFFDLGLLRSAEQAAQVSSGSPREAQVCAQRLFAGRFSDGMQKFKGPPVPWGRRAAAAALRSLHRATAAVGSPVLPCAGSTTARAGRLQDRGASGARPGRDSPGATAEEPGPSASRREYRGEATLSVTTQRRLQSGSPRPGPPAPRRRPAFPALAAVRCGQETRCSQWTGSSVVM